MKNLLQLTVNLAKRSYPIYIGENLLDQLAVIKSHIAAKQVMIVSNETVAALYLPKLKLALKNYQVETLLLKDGEQFKNWQSLQAIIDALVAKNFHRDATLIALGGGVIGDITGFAAAIYQRGIGFIQIPTTLLAQVDASVGGKTAINHPQAKNFIGAFYQPNCVLIDINVLHTLPAREFSAGIAEIIKIALVADANFFDELKQNMPSIVARTPEVLSRVIARACELKANIVSLDETEKSDTRALLNLGHTFGHAIESALSYQDILHGEAVAIGISLAAQLSHRLGKMNDFAFLEILAVLHLAGLPLQIPKQLTAKDLLQRMQQDKKVQANQLRLVLLDRIGQAVVVNNVKQDEISQTLSANLQTSPFPIG